MKLFNCVQKRALAHLRMLSTKCVYKSYMYLIYMCTQDLALNNLQWLICHKIKPNQTKPNPWDIIGVKLYFSLCKRRSYYTLLTLYLSSFMVAVIFVDSWYMHAFNIMAVLTVQRSITYHYCFVFSAFTIFSFWSSYAYFYFFKNTLYQLINIYIDIHLLWYAPS